MPSLYEKASQLLFVRLGSNMQPPVTAEEDAERVRALLDRCPVGGLLLFNGSVDKTPALLQDLQQRSDRQLLVASDVERGAGQQVSGCTVFPHAMALGRSEELVEKIARAAAREVLAVGIHIACMPVADVNRNPRNPIISIRAFGKKPDHVSRCASAYIRGCREEGLLTATKHFPGHGNTIDDSHADLPVVDDSRATILEQDVAPFRAAVEAGVDLVMTAHVSFPALDPQKRPATLSAPILQDLLRGKLGFSGAVITDSLLMGGIKGIYDKPGELAAAIIGAGVDILLDPEEPEQMASGLVRAVENGELSEERLDEAYGRVIALKDMMVERHGASWATSTIKARTKEERIMNEAMASQVARKAVVLLRGAPEKVHIPPRMMGPGNLLVVLIQPSPTFLDPPEQQPLGEVLRVVYPDVQYEEVAQHPAEDRLEEIRAAAREAKHVVIAMIVRPAAWHAYGLQKEQHAFVKTLVDENEVILAALGDPGILEAFPQAAAALCTYSDTKPSQHALVSTLIGASPVHFSPS